ncbi:MAG: serine hydrolase [Parerythrobacter sp.]
MPDRLRAPLIAAAAMLPVLSACAEAPVGPPPLNQAALDAVTDDPGAPTEDVARAVDALFTAPGIGETRAVIVMHEGTVAAERHAEGYDADTRHISWSMAKTVTAAMIGMLIADGRLALDDPAPIPAWRRPGDPRGPITVRHLLQMRSGLDHTEAGDPPEQSSEVRMLFLDGRDDMSRWAETQPLEEEPGERFEYSSNTTVILADIAARVLTDSDDPETRRAAVDGYLKARIFEPLGMASAVAEYDASGTLVGGSLMHATARDWARFAEFLRNKGSYRGSQLLPRAFVEAMVTPSPASPIYGLQTWLNRPMDTGADEHPLFPGRAAHSVFAMIGHMGQYAVVSPEQRVTVVRLGHSDADQRRVVLERMADVLALYPAPED